MELLPAIVGLAVVDSINPSALLATIVLLLRGRRARPLIAVCLAAVLATYLTIGVVLTLGLGLTPEAVIQSDAAYLVQGVLGAVMLAYALLAPSRRGRRRPVEAPSVPAATRPVAVFALGMAVTVLELPTALPYLGAVGAITRADLPASQWLPLLALYNLIFVLPPLVLLAGHLALGKRADAMLGRLRDRVGRGAREGLLWLLGLVGFFLLADAVGHFRSIGLSSPALPRLLSDHGLAVPGDVAAAFRALATLEGALRVLDPDFNIVTESRALATAQRVQALTPAVVQRTATEELATLLPTVRSIARRTDRITGALEQGRLTVNVRQFAHPDDRRFATGALHQALLAFLGAALGIMATLLLGAAGGPRLTAQLGLHQVLGYSMLTVGSLLMLRVLATILRPRR